MLWRHLHLAHNQFLGQTFSLASQGSLNQAHLRERANSHPLSSSLKEGAMGEGSGGVGQPVYGKLGVGAAEHPR